MKRKLKNLRIDEVSLVDKAANRRKFAVVKRALVAEECQQLEEVESTLRSLVALLKAVESL